MRKLAIFALSFSAAIFLSQYAIPEGWLLYLSGFFVLLGVFAVFFDDKRRLPALLLAFGLSIGFLWNFGYTQIFFNPAKALDGQTISIEAEATAYSEATSYGAKVKVKILREDSPDIKAVLYLNDEAPDIAPGDRLELRARLKQATTIQDSEVDYFTAQGIFLFAYQSGELRVSPPEGSGIKYIPAKMVRFLKDKIAEIFPEDTAALMQALLSGDTGLLSDSFYAALKTDGLSHAVAVSGMHVAFLVGLVTTLIPLRRRAAFVCIPVILIFMAMVGNTSSVVRAGIMYFFVLLAPVFRREHDSATSLGAALMLLLIVNPFAAAGVGLQLSFAATAGIIMFTNSIYIPLCGMLNKLRVAKFKPIGTALRFFAASFATSIGAIIFTTPLVILHFGYVSLIAPLANILVLWAVSLAFTGGLIACILGFVWSPIGAFAAGIAALPLRYIIWIVGKLSNIPFAAIYTLNDYFLFWPVYAYIMVAGFILLKGKLRRIALPVSMAAVSLCVVILITVFGSSDGLEITAVDVGQGQSIVLRSEGLAVVVDCGGNALGNEGDITAEYLLSQGQTRIDLLVLTHFHSDHAGGILQLLERMAVRQIAVPDIDDFESELSYEIISSALAKNIDILYVTEKTVMHCGGAEITLYPPIGTSGENERGLTILCTVGNFDMLITGDMDGSIERRLIRFYSLPDIELLIAGHHGSGHSTSMELLETVTPEIAIISVGYNSYGHPAEDVLERLLSVGAEIYRTDTMGNITVRVN